MKEEILKSTSNSVLILLDDFEIMDDFIVFPFIFSQMILFEV
jgi:hypothetical protein